MLGQTWSLYYEKEKVANDQETCPCYIQRFFSALKMKISVEKIKVSLRYLFKTLIVGTR